MKKQIALIVMTAAIGWGGAGCLGLFCPSNRMASEVLWDRPFVQDTVLPAVAEAKNRRALGGCLRQFELQLVDFYAFMRLVADGTIKVTENSKGGLWQSSLSKNGFEYSAFYPGKRAAIDQFDKRINRDPRTLVWGFVFHPNGRLRDVHTLDWGFRFDEAGKLRSFWFSTIEGENFLVIGEDGSVKSDFFEHPNAAVPAVKLIQNLLPTGWSLASTVEPAQFRPLSGLANPLGQITLAAPGKQLTRNVAPDRQVTFQPNVVLLLFARREAERVAAAVAKTAAGSRNAPMIFGWSRDYIFVTSPGYINDGVQSEDAHATIRELKASLAAGITFE
jgi:hypothetical protein